MACADPGGRIAVEVVHCPGRGQADLVALELACAATLRDALRASGLLERHRLDEATLRAGIWGREQPLHTPLRAGDRVEIYRTLQVDPKEARRLRYRKSGSKAKLQAGG